MVARSGANGARHEVQGVAARTDDDRSRARLTSSPGPRVSFAAGTGTSDVTAASVVLVARSENAAVVTRDVAALHELDPSLDHPHHLSALRGALRVE